MNYRSNVPSPKKKLSGGKPVEKAVADSEEKRESPDVAAKLRERVGRLLATPAELVIVRRISLRTELSWWLGQNRADAG
jgi:hypothetical protein